MKRNILYLVSILMIFSSCSSRLIDFTLISSKNIEFSQFPNYERGKTRTVGMDVKQIIVFIPLGEPSGKEALDRAIEAVPGCVALVDGVMSSKLWYIPYIYGKQWYVIEGTPIIDPALVKEGDELEDYTLCVLDKNGNINKKVELTKNQFNATKNEIMHNPKKYIRENFDR